MKLTVDEQKELIPDDDIHKAFLEREDIAPLAPDEQEKLWQEALININKFRGSLFSPLRVTQTVRFS